ncbi:hypothetical protein MVEN_02103700 [Mycena venus]|uniref:Uncharacterized protein n=1 Tax=Mycena venus TaxID=2733690 RepID=A0A8H7CI06_9AGAR|nr:hypothetical protein MVEN_02103700 [Mycena venus]
MPFPFTFKLPVPGLNPFSSPNETSSEAPKPPSNLGFTSQSPDQPRSRPARPNNINQRRPSPSPSPAPPLSRKRGWDPSLAEPSQSAATLASSNGYLDTPAKYRDVMVARQSGDEFELEDMTVSVSGVCLFITIIITIIRRRMEYLPPPAKRRRGLAGSIVSTAVSAALIGTAVGLTVYRLWRDRGKDPEPDQLPPPPYQKGEWTPVQQPKAIEITPPTPTITPRRRKVRPGAGASATKRRNHVRPRIHGRAFSPPSSTMSPPRTPFDGSNPMEDDGTAVEDKMDWIGDQLSILIQEGQKALGREIVVKSDAREDEVDDGCGVWEEEEEAVSTKSLADPPRTRPHYHGRPLLGSERGQGISLLRPPSYASRPSSASPRASRFEFASASLPSSATRWRSDAPGNTRGMSAESLHAGPDEEETYESPELKESMARARARLLATTHSSLLPPSVQRSVVARGKNTRMAIPELPSELWLYIASFIPNDEILESGLIGVNIHFYNLALNLRYSTIRVETVNTTTERLLQRLRDPIPASRVIRCVIRPEPNIKVHKAEPPKEPSPTFWQIITSGYATAWKQQPSPPPSVEDIIDSLILVFPGFTSLTYFEVESWDLSPEYDLQSFFRSAWSAFGRQLETISIAGRPENFRQLVASGPQPVSCTTLSLQFTHEPDMMAAVVDGILVNSVAPFINSLAPQLRALKIWSWSTLDLSALFLNLGRFPQLHDFHLRAPFNKAFSNPMGLTMLLEANSAGLDTIELRLNPLGGAMDPNHEQLLGQWFSSHQANPSVLTNLKFLRMYPTTLSSGFDALVMYIERSANTLTTLAVKDRYLNLDEVEALIAPVSHRAADDGLQALRLNVRVWNAELFDLLALKLPGLKSLSLYLFFTGMQTHSFKSWKLRDIGVWQGGSEVPSSTMRLLANCFPSVRSFWGNGHMLGERKLYEFNNGRIQ